MQTVPPPRLYLYFDAIIRHGSIRAAAETLRIASSALNRRLLDLERDVGTTLFDRCSSGVRLTAAGEIFAAHVRRTLNDAKRAADQIEGIMGRTGGHVAIGSAESAAIDVLPSLMIAFQQEYPGTRFTVGVGTPRELLEDLLDDRVDLILTHEEPTHHDVAVRAMARMPFCALMQSKHRLAGKPKLFIKECLNYPIILAQEQLAARALVESTLQSSSLKMQPVLVTNLFEVMKKYARLTDAISFQFHLVPLHDVVLDGLVAVPLADSQLADARLMLAVRRGRVLPTAAGVFCERIEHLLRQAAC
jgi:DNA-binding transcriptional LysR family regulator